MVSTLQASQPNPGGDWKWKEGQLWGVEGGGALAPRMGVKRECWLRGAAGPGPEQPGQAVVCGEGGRRLTGSWVKLEGL